MEGLAPTKQPLAVRRREIPEIDPRTLLTPAGNLCPQLQTVIEEFWALAPEVRLFSISPTPHYYWHMQDFYVAQKGLDDEGKRWAQLRISEGLCQFLFETVLGKSVGEPDFVLSGIRNFEVFLLERFSRRLFQVLSPPLLKKAGKKAPPPERDKLLHIVWALQGEPDQINQIILTAPQSCLQTVFDDLPQPRRWRFADDVFLHAHTRLVARLGRTQATLEELQHLEVGDMIILENSHAHTWELRDPGTGHYMPIAVNPPEHRRLPDLWLTQGPPPMPNEIQATPKNIWDNLEVEVSATFNPIRLPLRQVKEIEQGLVLEVGDLMDNRVHIEVEGHAIAWGELLIVGDKFGVRIQGLLQPAEETTPPPQVATQQNPDTMSAQPQGMADPMGHQPVQHPLETPVDQENYAPMPDQQMYENPPQQGDGLDDLDLDESDFDDLDDEEDWT